MILESVLVRERIFLLSLTKNFKADCSTLIKFKIFDKVLINQNKFIMKSTFFLLLISIFSFSQTPKVSSGKLVEIPQFSSTFIEAKMVRVWLPDGYNVNQKYQVLYANDGQMLWDSTITWNKQEWTLDEVLSELIKNKKVKPTIVVAVDNAVENRHSEYFPQKPYESLDKTFVDSIRNKSKGLFEKEVYSDQYLKFLVEELKPFIDGNYSTYTDPKHTFIMGSSMGGLISMYAICEYPQVFGGAICMSTHWPGIFETENNPIPLAFENYLNKNLPNPKNHKIYFDYGTETLDALYEPYQQKVDAIMKSKKFKRRNWETLKFTGADHSEQAWAKRLAIPLQFVLN